jgi:formylglycine-generating enzyme required for sulfatase activity
MVVVPSGSFLMGSRSADHQDELPLHLVTFARPFAVSRFAITFAQWDAALAERAVEELQARDGNGRQPAVNLTWGSCRGFAAWLRRRTGQNYRLLSEAEWEYCCRAGTSTRYSTGQRISAQQANFGRDPYATGLMVDVGTFPPNEWGLCEMHGNVWEWCEDIWHENYMGAPTDGSAWCGGESLYRVIRGGFWGSAPDHVRSAARHSMRQCIAHYTLGFRLARDID